MRIFQNYPEFRIFFLDMVTVIVILFKIFSGFCLSGHSHLCSFNDTLNTFMVKDHNYYMGYSFLLAAMVLLYTPSQTG